MKTITILARINTQYEPKLGEHAKLTLEARGTKEGYYFVERGNASDSEIELMRYDFHFVRLREGAGIYKIDTIVPMFNSSLKTELITLNEY